MSDGRGEWQDNSKYGWVVSFGKYSLHQDSIRSYTKETCDVAPIVDVAKSEAEGRKTERATTRDNVCHSFLLNPPLS